MVGLEKCHLASQGHPRFGTMETGAQKPGRARSESHQLCLPPSQVLSSLVSSTPFEEAFEIWQNMALSL